MVQKVLQPHPHVLGFTQWCIVLKQLLFVLLVRGVKLRTIYVIILVTSLPDNFESKKKLLLLYHKVISLTKVYELLRD